MLLVPQNIVMDLNNVMSLFSHDTYMSFNMFVVLGPRSNHYCSLLQSLVQQVCGLPK